MRNPIYGGIFLGGFGLVLVTPSPWIAVASLLGYAGVAYQTRREEQHMLRLHGDRYLAWARRVGRFVPWIGTLGGDAEGSRAP